MSHACSEHGLDALLAGELSPPEAERVRAHARTCATCARSRAWLQLEREWMARRAQSQPARPALSFEQLQAKLAAAAQAPAERRAVPHRSRRQPRGLLALGMLTAVMGVAFSLLPMLQSYAPVAACTASGATVAASDVGANACYDDQAMLEARLGACLVATPLR